MKINKIKGCMESLWVGSAAGLASGCRACTGTAGLAGRGGVAPGAFLDKICIKKSSILYAFRAAAKIDARTSGLVIENESP